MSNINVVPYASRTPINYLDKASCCDDDRDAVSLGAFTQFGPLESFDDFRERLPEFRASFGINLERWRRSNGWTQDTCQEIGAFTKTPHVYGSKWSQLERGVAINPGPLVFHALGSINVALAEGSFLEPGLITDRKLRDKVRDSKAVCHENGSPWQGFDFFAAFTGQLKWPNRSVGRVMTAENAVRYSQELHEQLLKIKNSKNFRTITILSELEDIASAYLNKDQSQKLLDVVMGISDYRPSELQELWDEEEACFRPTPIINKLKGNLIKYG